MIQDLDRWFAQHAFWDRAIHIAAIILLAYLATLLARKLIHAVQDYSTRTMLKSGAVSDFELAKQAKTIGWVLSRTINVVVWFTAIFMALEAMRFPVQGLLASAGIVGVAVGFGAQTLVKDVISGMFLLLENQMRVNDVVVINGTAGAVEEINLRTTVLRGENGSVHIFPNGAIQSLSNLTVRFSYWVFEFQLALDERPDRVIRILEDVASSVAGDEQYKDAVLAPVEIYGVDAYSDKAMVIKGRIKTVPGKQWSVGREMNRRLQVRFGEENIRFASPVSVVRLLKEGEEREKAPGV